VISVSDPPPVSGAARLVAALREAGIRDERVLSVMERTPRNIFVPGTFGEHCWDNVALPIGHAQTISQPFVVAAMTEALELSERHKVLEIGTGSGYQTAILARLCRRVFTIERHQSLLRDAEKRFAYLRLGNITSRYGDGTRGWPEPAPYDRIIVTAAAASLPQAVLQLLAPDGILVAPVGGERRDQTLVRVRQTGGRSVVEELGTVRFVPLVPGLPRHNPIQRDLPL
jgi:protein-L-isoaspartate(D-aspartate) O-methyltransferase